MKNNIQVKLTRSTTDFVKLKEKIIVALAANPQVVNMHIATDTSVNIVIATANCIIEKLLKENDGVKP